MSAIEAASRYRWAILGICLISHFSGSLGGQVLAPVAPLFQPDLGLSKTEVGLFSAAAFAGAWVISLIAGSLTDRFGIRAIMSLGQVLTGLLLLSMVATGSVLQAAAVMFGVGMSRGSVFPGTTKAILDWFSPAVRATAMGLKQTGAPMSGVMAAATLPMLGLALGWRAAIAATGLGIVASGVVTALLYRDPPRLGRAPVVKRSMRTGLRDVLRNRALWTIGSVAVFYMVVQQSLITYLTLYLKEIVLVPTVPEEGARIVAAGGFLAVCQMGGVFGRLFWGVVSDRVFHGRRGIVLAIIGALSTLTALVMGTLEPGCPLWLLTVIAFGAGASTIAWNALLHTMVSETAGRLYAATAVGFTLTMIEAGTTMGPPMFGLMVDLAGSYRTAWLSLCGVGAAGTLVAIAAARRERRAES